ncbi:MFS general substrate transporter [Hypoxylon rubiginosum]|uniref:MFS general substrate transporter n=1 Tax=Hypoxylon rubiginosum TaxID=110542 RepID=A0ACC0CSI7_9PEZI|nr:MFS general substrate transporter [Hypoxylon rubiginosum]
MASKSTPPASVDMDSSSSPPKTPFEDTTIAKPENSKNAPKTDITDDIDPANEVQGTKLILIHLSVCLCTFLVGLDFNLIATAVPIITSEFNSTRDIGWYGAAFMVALCASQPLTGKTYTLFPKKLTYLLYVLLFEVGSLVCALAPSSKALIGGRVIAGLGASGLFAGGFAITTTIIPLHKRAVYTGTLGSTFAIASIVGPIIGGAFAQHVTWRWCFYINLPIGGAAAIAFFFLVHLRPAETEKQALVAKLKSLDAVGFALFGGSITMLLLALQWGGVEYAWSSSVIIGQFVGFGVTMLLFVAWVIYRGESALIPPRLFTVNRNPALLCAASFFVNGPFQVIIYWLPIWFQGVLGSSPTSSGVNFFPTVISDVLASFIGAALVTQLGWWNPFLLFGEAIVCIGGGLLTTIYPDISGSHWIGYQILGGVGYSLVSNLSHLAMQASLPQDLVPLGSSTLLTLISTSCAIFLAIGQTIFQGRLQTNMVGVVSNDVVQEIINSGVTNVRSLVDESQLPTLIQQYSLSVTQVFYLPAVAPAISFFILLGCKWISTKSKQSPNTEAAVENEKNDPEKGTAS